MSAGKAYNWTIYLENDNLGGAHYARQNFDQLIPKSPWGGIIAWFGPSLAVLDHPWFYHVGPG